MAKELNEAVEAVVTLAVAVDKQLVDGYQWTDLFGIIPALTKLPAAIKDADKIDEELANWTPEDQASLVEVIDQLDLNSDLSEKLAKQGAILALEFGRMIVLVREARKD